MGSTAMSNFYNAVVLLSQISKAATNTVFCPFCYCLNQSNRLMPKIMKNLTTTAEHPAVHTCFLAQNVLCVPYTHHASPLVAVCVRDRGERWVRQNHHLVASLLAASQVRVSQNKPGKQSSVCPDGFVTMALKVDYNSKSRVKITNFKVKINTLQNDVNGHLLLRVKGNWF